MVKQGGRIKTWRNRFFVLNPQRRMLSYFSDHFMKECKGHIYFDAFQRVYGSNSEVKKTAQEYVSYYVLFENDTIVLFERLMLWCCVYDEALLSVALSTFCSLCRNF